MGVAIQGSDGGGSSSDSSAVISIITASVVIKMLFTITVLTPSSGKRGHMDAPRKAFGGFESGETLGSSSFHFVLSIDM